MLAINNLIEYWLSTIVLITVTVLLIMKLKKLEDLDLHVSPL